MRSSSTDGPLSRPRGSPHRAGAPHPGGSRPHELGLVQGQSRPRHRPQRCRPAYRRWCRPVRVHRNATLMMTRRAEPANVLRRLRQAAAFSPGERGRDHRPAGHVGRREHGSRGSRRPGVGSPRRIRPALVQRGAEGRGRSGLTTTSIGCLRLARSPGVLTASSAALSGSPVSMAVTRLPDSCPIHTRRPSPQMPCASSVNAAPVSARTIRWVVWLMAQGPTSSVVRRPRSLGLRIDSFPTPLWTRWRSRSSGLARPKG